MHTTELALSLATHDWRRFGFYDCGVSPAQTAMGIPPTVSAPSVFSVDTWTCPGTQRFNLPSRFHVWPLGVLKPVPSIFPTIRMFRRIIRIAEQSLPPPPQYIYVEGGGGGALYLLNQTWPKHTAQQPKPQTHVLFIFTIIQLYKLISTLCSAVPLNWKIIWI